MCALVMLYVLAAVAVLAAVTCNKNFGARLHCV